MSPPGRPKGEFSSAQHEGTPVSTPDLPNVDSPGLPPDGQPDTAEIAALLADNPFPGLRSYEPAEADRFFGRREQIDALVRRLAQVRLVAVSGASGCGKSSLVKAGLLEELKRRHEEDDDTRWLTLVLRPENRPMANLAAALAHALPAIATVGGDRPVEADAPDPQALRLSGLFGQLHLGELALVDVVRQARLPAATRVLVVVDQFEELFRFRRMADSDEASAFVALLLRAAAEPTARISVVLTMRSDALGGCADFAGLPEAVSAGSYLVPRLTRSQREEAIVKPIAWRGAEIAPRLVQRLLNDVSADFDDLPVMQHALSRTWRHWAQAANRRLPGGGNRPVDIEDYAAIGTAASALTQHAEEARSSLDALGGQGGAVERVFRALTERTAEGMEVRRPIKFGQLSAICGGGSAQGRADVLAVVERYRRADTAFLVPGPPVDLADDQVIDISHESLIRQWDALRVWATDEAAAKAKLDRLVVDARGRDADQAEYWTGRDLEGARDWQRRNQPNAAWVHLCRGGSDDQARDDFTRVVAFLDQSTEAQHRSQRRSRLMLWGMRALAIGVTVTSLATVVVGWHLQQKALARDWAGQAILQVVQDPSRSAELALQALEKDPGHDRAEFALRRAMASLEVARTEQTLVFKAPISMTRYTVDNRLLAVASGAQVWLLDERVLLGGAEPAGGRTRAVEALSPAPVRLQAPDDLINLHPLSDGRVVVETASGGVALLGPGPTASQVLPCDGGWSDGIDVVDGLVNGGRSRVAVNCSNGPVRVWDLQQDAATMVWESPVAVDDTHTSALAFSPDGTHLAMGDTAGRVRVLALAGNLVQDYGRLDAPLKKPGTAKKSKQSEQPEQPAPPTAVEFLRFSKTRPGQLLAANGGGNTRLWTLSLVPRAGAGEPMQNLELKHDHPVSVAHFPAPGALDPDVLVSVAKRSVSLWRPPYDKPVLKFAHDSPVLNANLSADGEMVVTTGADGLLRLWSGRSTVAVAVLRGHADRVTSALWHPAPSLEGGDRRVISSSLDGTLRIWRIQPPELLAAGGRSRNAAALVSRVGGAGTHVMLCGDFLLERADPCEYGPLKSDRPSAGPPQPKGDGSGITLSPHRLSLSPDGQLALFAIDYDGVFGGRGLHLIRTTEATPGAAIQPVGADLLVNAHHASFASAADVVAVLGREVDEVKLWRREDLLARGPPQANPLAVIPSTPGRLRDEVALSPDGKWVATAEAAKVKLWARGNGEAGELKGVELPGHSGRATAMAFSASGSKFVAASTDRTARVWTLDASGQKPIGDPINLEGGHSAAVTSASFSPDGRWVVTSGMEGSIRVWDGETGAEKSALLNRHRGKINQVVFDPSGERIISVGDDGMALVSTCKSCVMPLDDLRKQARRELSLTDDDVKWLKRAMN